MIATFIIDWPVLIFIGVVFGAFAPGTSWWRGRAFVAGLVTAAVFTATAVISYFIEPDWMWMYFLDPDEVSWVVPLIPVGFLLLYALAFAAAVSLRQLDRLALWAAGALALLAEIVVVAVTWDRYRLVGTRQEWLADKAHELFSTSPSGPVKTIGLLGPVFAAVFLAALYVVYRSRRAAAADR